MRRTVQFPFIDPSPTDAFSGRVSAPFGPQPQPATTHEAEFVVCDQSIYHYFRTWRLDGTWERVNGALRERVHAMAGREATPGAAIVDSQSVKTTCLPPLSRLGRGCPLYPPLRRGARGGLPEEGVEAPGAWRRRRGRGRILNIVKYRVSKIEYRELI